MKWLNIFVAASLFGLHSAYAFDEMNASPEEIEKAIIEVQKQMQSPSFATQAAKESPEAKQVADQVRALSGNPETEAEIYKLAAEVLGNMKGKSLTDIQRILESAQRDPASFAELWKPEQKQKLNELSRKLPAANQTSP